MEDWERKTKLRWMGYIKDDLRERASSGEVVQLSNHEPSSVLSYEL